MFSAPIEVKMLHVDTSLGHPALPDRDGGVGWISFNECCVLSSNTNLITLVF